MYKLANMTLPTPPPPNLEASFYKEFTAIIPNIPKKDIALINAGDKEFYGNTVRAEIVDILEKRNSVVFLPNMQFENTKAELISEMLGFQNRHEESDDLTNLNILNQLISTEKKKKIILEDFITLKIEIRLLVTPTKDFLYFRDNHLKSNKYLNFYNKNYTAIFFLPFKTAPEAAS